MYITTELVIEILKGLRSVADSEILPFFRNLDPTEICTKDGKNYDYVTKADLNAELALKQFMASLFPGCTILSEEDFSRAGHEVVKVDENDEWTVIIDPLDGTSNFIEGCPIFGTIISVFRRGVSKLGILYDPLLGDAVVGLHQHGADFISSDGRLEKITAKPIRRVDAMTGFVGIDLAEEKDRVELIRAFDGIGRISSYRCSCHEYRAIAMGHADFLVSPRPQIWDHAAGALVVQEIGGTCLLKPELNTEKRWSKNHTFWSYRQIVACRNPTMPTSVARCAEQIIQIR